MENAVVRRLSSEDGMSTAEYAVGTCGAVGLAGILVKVLTSPEILEVIKAIIIGVLKMFLPGV
jgi:hypothetical protein